jgi:hypothetical protein
MADMYIDDLGNFRWHEICSQRRRVIKMTVVVIGAALLGSFATAFVMQKVVLGVMLRALERDKEDASAKRV